MDKETSRYHRVRMTYARFKITEHQNLPCSEFSSVLCLT